MSESKDVLIDDQAKSPVAAREMLATSFSIPELLRAIATKLGPEQANCAIQPRWLDSLADECSTSMCIETDIAAFREAADIAEAALLRIKNSPC